MPRSAPFANIVALVAISASLLSPAAARASDLGQQRPASGPEFVHPDSELFASMDPSLPTEQHRAYFRLLERYLNAPDATSYSAYAGRWLGLDLPLEELARDSTGWLGNEVFVATSGQWDWSWMRSSGSPAGDCTEYGVLAGAAIRNMPAFTAFMTSWANRLRTQGSPTRTERYGNVDITWAGRSPEPGGGVYFAVSRGYLLISNSRTTLVEALDRRAERSLASNSTFQASTRDLPTGRSATFYANMPPDFVSQLAPGARRSGIQSWGALSVGLAGEGVQVSWAGAPGFGSTAAEQALLAKPPTAFRSVQAAPRDAQLFLAWDNPKLLWDIAVENIYPNRQEYESARRYEHGGITFDFEDDLIGWMTGEVAFFIAPASQPTSVAGPIGFGFLIEAKDRSLAAAKIDKLFDLLEAEKSSRGSATTETIAGLTFRRVFDEDFGVYGGMVDDWAVIASDAANVAGAVTAARGGPGLSSNPEFASVRASLPARSQTLIYANAADLADLARTVAGPRFGNQYSRDPISQSVRGVGISYDWSADRAFGTSFAHVVIPPDDQLPPIDTSWLESIRPAPTALVDFSHSGLSEPAPFGRPPQFEPIARFFHSQGTGSPSVAVVQPGQRVTYAPWATFDAPRIDPGDPSVVPASQAILIRLGSVGTYSAEEIQAYQSYTRCGGILLLLSDEKGTGETDALAAAFGFTATGSIVGPPFLTTYAAGTPFVDDPPLPLGRGTGLTGWPTDTRRIGVASPDAFLDLNGNGARDTGEPAAPVVLATRAYGRGTVAFLGTTSIVEEPDHPLTGQLLRYLLPEARWARPLARDRFEPDDSPSAARPITLGEIQESRSLHERDNDWVTFQLNVGDRVTLETGGSCDTYLLLYGDNAIDVLAFDDDGGDATNARLRFTAAESGTYFARVRHFNETSGTCGSYRLMTSVDRQP